MWVAKDFHEVVEKPFPYFRNILLSTKLLRHRSHVGPGETAGDDALEVAQIGIHVQRQAVKGNAAAHREADGGNFFVADPNAGERRPACAGESEVA